MSVPKFSKQSFFFASALIVYAQVQALPVIAKDPSLGFSGIVNDVTIRIAEGQSALQSGNVAVAEKAFLEANRLNPKSVEALLGLAMVAQTQGKTSQAQTWMSSAVGVAPGNPKILQAQARLQLDMGRGDLAEAGYRKAIAAYPGVPQLRLDFAKLCVDELAKPAEAIAILRELQREKPDDASVYLNLGLAYSAAGSFEQASDALAQSVRRDAGNPFAQHALGHVLLRRGLAEQALAAFNKALVLRPDFLGAMLGRGDALAALGRTEEALTVYRRSADLAPGNAMSHALRAQFLERLKRLDEAEAAYRDALKIDPSSQLLLNNLAALLASRKIKLDEAHSLATRAVTANPKRASFIDTLGSVQLAQGNFLAARKSFEQALSLEPSNQGFKRHLDLALAGSAQLSSNTSIASKTAVSAPLEQNSRVAATMPTSEPRIASPVAENTVIELARQLGPQLEAWRQAWESKDAGRYLAYYGSGFIPADKRSRAAWETDRRSKLNKPGEITVEISQPNYSMKGDIVSVVFEQRYQSSNFRDRARKQIDWVREGKDWRIVREVSL